jgi:hypothetical protein
MRLVGTFIVFFMVYGTLHYLFTERKRKDGRGRVQSTRRALLRSSAVSAVAGSIFTVLSEVMEFL